MSDVCVSCRSNAIPRMETSHKGPRTINKDEIREGFGHSKLPNVFVTTLLHSYIVNILKNMSSIIPPSAQTKSVPGQEPVPQRQPAADPPTTQQSFSWFTALRCPWHIVFHTCLWILISFFVNLWEFNLPSSNINLWSQSPSSKNIVKYIQLFTDPTSRQKHDVASFGIFLCLHLHVCWVHPAHQACRWLWTRQSLSFANKE